MATSENYFLVIWAKDFGPEKVMENPEYFVYCGFFITRLWGERFAQSPKGEFLEVPSYRIGAKRQYIELARSEGISSQRS